METDLKAMEAQLGRCAQRIDRLAARTMRAGVEPGFETLMHVDELKVLYAVAQAKLLEFGAAASSGRSRLEMELKDAWSDLEAAMKRR